MIRLTLMEIEEIANKVKVTVRRTGQVIVEPLDKDASLPMSPTFWQNLERLLTNMAERITELEGNVRDAHVEIAEMDQAIGQLSAREKLVLVGPNRKQMFAAGVAFARGLDRRRD